MKHIIKANDNPPFNENLQYDETGDESKCDCGHFPNDCCYGCPKYGKPVDESKLRKILSSQTGTLFTDEELDSLLAYLQTQIKVQLYKSLGRRHGTVEFDDSGYGPKELQTAVRYYPYRCKDPMRDSVQDNLNIALRFDDGEVASIEDAEYVIRSDVSTFVSEFIAYIIKGKV